MTEGLNSQLHIVYLLSVLPLIDINISNGGVHSARTSKLCAACSKSHFRQIKSSALASKKKQLSCFTKKAPLRERNVQIMQPESAVNPDGQASHRDNARGYRVSGVVHSPEYCLPLLLRRSHSGITACKPALLQS